MRRVLRKGNRRTKRHYKKHLGFLGTLKRYLDILAG